jgi:DNA-binding NtrC family response regulator
LQRADIRLISATHRPLRELIATERFRQDLYFRLNTFPIHLPPLRERREDIGLLATAMLARVAPGRSLGFSAEALDALMDYPFPGNVRELRNVIERASLMADGDLLQPRHLALEEGSNGIAHPGSLGRKHSGAKTSDAELVQAAKDHRGTRSELAQKLGLSERTLYRRLRAAG